MEESAIYDQIQEAIRKLEAGSVLLYPTDTIWGIGCDALNEKAINRVAKIKGREDDKPFLLLVDSISMLKNYVLQIHPRIETLLSFHDRPLTLLYESAAGLPSSLISKDRKVAIRIVKEGLCHQLIERFGRPIVSTSANKQGIPFPKNFGEISSDLIRQVDFVLHMGEEELATGEPSVIAGFDRKGELFFIRE